MTSDSSRLKDPFAGAVLAATVMLLACLANLPYQYIERDGQWLGSLQFSDSEGDRRMDDLPTMAGWPLRYWVRYELEDRVEDRYWSAARLVGNVAVAFSVAALVFLFTMLRGRAIASARTPRRARRARDGWRRDR